MDEIILCVFGSRTIENYYTVVDCIEEAFDTWGLDLDALIAAGKLRVISGGARGVDWMSEQWAAVRGIEPEVKLADWKNLDAPGAVIRRGKHGLYNAKAGPDRNQKMADLATHFVGIRAPGKSQGTDDMLQRVKATKKPLQMFKL